MVEAGTDLGGKLREEPDWHRSVVFTDKKQILANNKTELL